MISGRIKHNLTPDSVLQKISEYDIFRYYMPSRDWKINQVTYSPFRNESNPSFLIGNKYGKLTFIDFADSQYRGDCFDFVKMMFGVSMNDALKIIDKDFGLGLSSGVETSEYKRIVSEYKQPEEVGKRYSLIQVITRKLTSEELSYWNQYHQDVKDMKDNNIYSVKKVFLNKKLFPLKETELRFGYFYDGYWKIYKPFSDRKSKWMPNNVPITTLDGKENIKNVPVAFINKSKKDYMVMKKIIPYTCAVQNEGIGCFSQENISFFKGNSERQVLSFDSDIPGVKNSQQITQMFGFDYCNVPKLYLRENIKDWADLAKVHGLDVIRNILIQKQLL